MIRLTFALGLMVLAIAAASPARADFAVIKFGSGYCRVWTNTAWGPEDGRFLHFPRWSWHYRFATWDGASLAMRRAVAWHRCYHWW